MRGLFAEAFITDDQTIFRMKGEHENKKQGKKKKKKSRRVIRGEQKKCNYETGGSEWA